LLNALVVASAVWFNNRDVLPGEESKTVVRVVIPNGNANPWSKVWEKLTK